MCAGFAYNIGPLPANEIISPCDVSREAILRYRPGLHELGAVDMTGLHAIVYTSEAYPIERTRLIRMFEAARRFNAQVAVTGVLFHHAGRFFQHIEGPEDAVRRVYARIVVSTLHHSLKVLLDAPLSERHFDSWYMGFCEPPESAFEAIANAEWISAMPVTRTTLARSESLSLVLSYWSRWVADQPEKAAPDAFMKP